MQGPKKLVKMFHGDYLIAPLDPEVYARTITGYCGRRAGEVGLPFDLRSCFLNLPSSSPTSSFPPAHRREPSPRIFA